MIISWDERDRKMSVSWDEQDPRTSVGSDSNPTDKFQEVKAFHHSHSNVSGKISFNWQTGVRQIEAKIDPLSFLKHLCL